MTLEEEPSGCLLEQDFSLLEEALNGGVWEVDGDDLNLYTCDGDKGDGPAGAVIVSSGDSGAVTELVHRLKGGAGARVTSLVLRLLCEEIDVQSEGTFTVGLAFDEDLEESSLLSVTLRRPRHSPGEHEDTPNSKDEALPPRPVGLHLNGEPVAEDLGELPCYLELEAALSWEGERKVVLRHHTGPDGAAGDRPPQPAEASAGFYTTGVSFETARALYLRTTGGVKVRLLYAQCGGDD
mmetsp:Transcript_64790/g.169636  ORF Transcript_64790/g.169636 Transcript_64790/m.169636 type:complete len:238 (-) Transcript_64790:19-732(-)